MPTGAIRWRYGVRRRMLDCGKLVLSEKDLITWRLRKYLNEKNFSTTKSFFTLIIQLKIKSWRHFFLKINNTTLSVYANVKSWRGFLTFPCLVCCCLTCSIALCTCRGSTPAYSRRPPCQTRRHTPCTLQMKSTGLCWQFRVLQWFDPKLVLGRCDIWSLSRLGLLKKKRKDLNSAIATLTIVLLHH